MQRFRSGSLTFCLKHPLTPNIVLICVLGGMHVVLLDSGPSEERGLRQGCGTDLPGREPGGVGAPHRCGQPVRRGSVALSMERLETSASVGTRTRVVSSMGGPRLLLFRHRAA